MPTYEYQCSKCGEIFEAFQSITAEPLTKCEKCGSEGTVKRLLGAGAGLIFKGSGFYITDYKKSSAGAPSDGKKSSSETAPKKTETPSSGSKESSSTKTDTKS